MATFNLSDIPNVRPVPGFPGYLVSDTGLVLSLWRFRAGIRKDGMARELIPYTDKKGYMGVHLMRDGKSHGWLVHRLVLTVFRGPCPDGMESRHLDGNNDHNWLQNLAWGTHYENEQDRRLHGTLPIGSGVYNAKLNSERIEVARYLIQKGFNHRQIAVLLNVSRSTVTLALAGKSWKSA